jgi:hypothetical protein
MTDMVRGVLEDSRKGLLFNDFSGGLCTDTGGLSLAANQTPDSLNVFAWEGSLHFRGGYSSWSTLPASADGAYTYYDVNDNVHIVAWAGGNMYDVSTGSPITIASGVYVPGQTIAHAQLNGILYWSTATVPLRQWDGTTEKAVPNSGGTGVVPPPACAFLVAFQGSLVAVNFTTTAGAQPGAFIWSNVNDPTTWVGANVQTVGSNDGGICTFALLMGVAQVGVSPTKQFMVGKSNNQIFLYLGALGSLTENAVSSPVGVRDGASAVYIPTQQGLGAVMFLGDDGLFYLCNGIECPVASNNIKVLTNNLVNAALAQNPGQRFNAVYNQRFQYYMCDFGNNTQLIYKWDTGAWWYFQGWPSGVYTTYPTGSGLPTIFVGANYGNTTGVYELAIDQTDDNGNPISAYWSSPYVHGGKPERLKLFQECTVFAYNVGCQYALTAYGIPQSNGVTPTTQTALLNDPAVGAYPSQPTEVALWGQAVWGQSLWGGNQAGTIVQPYAIGGMKTPLIVPSGVSKWGPAGYPLPLRTGGAQFRIAWNAGVPDFRITSFKVSFLFQNENVGILPYSNQGQVTNISPNWGNRFTNTGNAPPTGIPSNVVNVPGFFGYNAVSGVALQNLSATITPDGQSLALIAEGQYDSVVLLISTSTGAITSIDPFAGVDGGPLQGLLMNPVGGACYVITAGDGFSNGPGCICYTISDGVLGEFPVFVSLGGNVNGTIGSCAISQDGTKVAVVDPASALIYILDTGSQTASSFSYPTSPANFGLGVTFVNGDNSNIIIASDSNGFQLVQYSITGSLIHTWTIPLETPGGLAPQLPILSTDPVTGDVIGAYSLFLSDNTWGIFRYDTTTSALKLQQGLAQPVGNFVPDGVGGMFMGPTNIANTPVYHLYASNQILSTTFPSVPGAQNISGVVPNSSLGAMYIVFGLPTSNQLAFQVAGVI